MKFQIVLNDKDGVSGSLYYASFDTAVEKFGYGDETTEEFDAYMEKKEEELRKFCSRWIGKGREITIEFDTENNTAVVILKEEKSSNK